MPHNYVQLTEEEEEEDEEDEEENVEEGEEGEGEEEEEDETLIQVELPLLQEKDTTKQSNRRRREWRSESVPFSSSPDDTEQQQNGELCSENDCLNYHEIYLYTCQSYIYELSSWCTLLLFFTNICS